MSYAWTRTTTIVLSALTALGAAASTFPPSATAQPTDEDAAALKKLLVQRRDAARIELDSYEHRVRNGLAADVPVPGALRLLESELDLAADREARLKVLREHADRMRRFEDVQQTLFRAGRLSREALAVVEWHRLDAEIRLLREKGRKG